METNEYPWYSPGFKSYNEAQSKVIPFCDKDINLVVCFPTATGKTVIAEAAMAYHLQNNGKAVYLSPFRALCEEKFEKWQNDFFLSKSGVAIKIGDHESSDEKQRESGLSLLTFESFDVRTKNSLWHKWLQSLSVIAIDEAHLVGDKDRGRVLETALMRAVHINPEIRLILLSATLGNGLEIAKWVKRLNGKPTKFFKSDWRPNEIDYQEIVCHGLGDSLDKIVELCKDSRNQIVFVHSKLVGKDLLKKMRKAGIKSAFHCASLNSKKREIIEQAFINQRIDVLISTSTLGAGVNLSG